MPLWECLLTALFRVLPPPMGLVREAVPVWLALTVQAFCTRLRVPGILVLGVASSGEEAGLMAGVRALRGCALPPQLLSSNSGRISPTARPTQLRTGSAR